MKPSPACLRLAAFAFALAMVAAAGSAARAFTIDNSGNNSNGSPKFVGPNDQVQNFGQFGSGNSSGSGTRFYYGTQPLDQSRDNWSNPVSRPLRPDVLNPGSNRN
jgi:hypothetical protein